MTVAYLDRTLLMEPGAHDEDEDGDGDGGDGRERDASLSRPQLPALGQEKSIFDN